MFATCRNFPRFGSLHVVSFFGSNGTPAPFTSSRCNSTSRIASTFPCSASIRRPNAICFPLNGKNKSAISGPLCRREAHQLLLIPIQRHRIERLHHHLIPTLPLHRPLHQLLPRFVASPRLPASPPAPHSTDAPQSHTSSPTPPPTPPPPPHTTNKTTPPRATATASHPQPAIPSTPPASPPVIPDEAHPQATSSLLNELNTRNFIIPELITRNSELPSHPRPQHPLPSEKPHPPASRKTPRLPPPTNYHRRSEEPPQKPSPLPLKTS